MNPFKFTIKTGKSGSYLYLQSSKYDKKKRKPVTSSYSLGSIKRLGQIIDEMFQTSDSVFLGESLLLALSEKLKLTRRFFKALQEAGATPKQRKQLAFLIATRGIRPFSKLGSTRYLKHSLCHQQLEITHVNECYKAMKLLKDPEAFFRQYSQATLATLDYSPEATYFDTTSIFFYSNLDDFRKKGFNKDHRRGAPQIILALSCTEKGLPLNYKVYPGNTSDPRCFRDFLALPPDPKTILVFDDGCYSFEQIQVLESQQYRYIAGCDITRYEPVGELQQHTLNQQRWCVQEAEYQDHRVIEAYNLENREQALEKLERKVERIEQFLVQVKGRTIETKQQKVQELILSLGLKSVFKVNQEEDKLTLIKNEKNLIRQRQRTKKVRIMTNLDLPSNQVLAQYLKRVDIERIFRHLKSPLAIRPVYHSTKQAIQAHIFIALMGYLQLITLQIYLQTKYQVILPIESLLEELNFMVGTTIEPRPEITITYAGKQPSWVYPLLQDLELPIRSSNVLSDLSNSDS